MHKEKETEREKYRLLGLARMKREEEEKARQVGKEGGREGGWERRGILSLAFRCNEHVSHVLFLFSLPPSLLPSLPPQYRTQ
jgi:hypothetical protein